MANTDQEFLIAVRDLLKAIDAGERALVELDRFGRIISDHEIGAQARDEALQLFVAAFSAPLGQTDIATTAACMLMEAGASCEELLPLVLWKFKAFLKHSAEFVDYWKGMLESKAESESDEEFRNALVAQLRSEWPKPYYTWELVHIICWPITMYLSSSIRARKIARGMPEISQGLRVLMTAPLSLGLPHQEDSRVRFRMLELVLKAMDGEVITILDPEERKAYRIRGQGIVSIAQLMILIADELFADGVWSAPGRIRPDPDIASAAKDRNVDPNTTKYSTTLLLSGWQGLNRDGAVDAGHALHPLGMPCDIPAIDGEQVVILSTGKFERSWDAGRPIGRLNASLEIVERLSPSQLDEWTLRIARHKEESSADE